MLVTGQGGASVGRIGRRLPQRGSIVFDDPAIDRSNGSAQIPLARANISSCTGRLADDLTKDKPVIETVVQIGDAACRACTP